MRILIETEEQNAPSTSINPAVTVAQPAANTAVKDGGMAPAGNVLTGASTTDKATEAGAPPNWLIEGINAASTAQASLINGKTDSIYVNGGEGL